MKEAIRDHLPAEDLEPVARENILRLAEAYARAKGISLRSVSKYAYGEGDFLEQVRAGKRSFTLRKYDEMRRWFARNRPKGMRWPKLKEPWAEVRREA